VDLLGYPHPLDAHDATSPLSRNGTTKVDPSRNLETTRLTSSGGREPATGTTRPKFIDRWLDTSARHPGGGPNVLLVDGHPVQKAVGQLTSVVILSARRSAEWINGTAEAEARTRSRVGTVAGLGDHRARRGRPHL
jgi:prepilin-type processing-associated H-X9-DG protein